MGYALAVDIGNTNITMGLFKGRRIIRKDKIPSSSHNGVLRRAVSSFLSDSKTSVDCNIISSVVPVAVGGLKKVLSAVTGAETVVVGRDIITPIDNLYKIKKEVGQDRLVNAFAARSLYGSPGVIIDFGTAITFDILSRKGQYLGGLIMPGIELGLRSLYENTALLPKIDLKETGSIIGRDTRQSMRSGILFGYGAMCDALIVKYTRLLGKGTKAIATGGNAGLIKKYSDLIQIVDEDLTLKGLQLISEICK